MKLLYVLHQFFPKHYWGTERFTLGLAAQMQRMGHDPTVVTYEPDIDVEFERITESVLVKRYSYQSIPVIALRHMKQADVSLVFHREIEDAFKSLGLRFDLVHVCHPAWVSSIARSCKIQGDPIVLTLTDAWLLCPRGLLDLGFGLCNGPEAGQKCGTHCGYALRSRYEDAKTLYYLADEIVAASAFLPTLFEANEWNRGVRIIPHSVDYRNVRESNNRQVEDITFGYIGAFAWHKGVHVLVKAARKVSESNMRVKIYGSPSKQSDYFNDLVDLAQGDPRIRFLDPFEIERLSYVMAEMSALVIPSVYYENYPLVLLMALAHKVPVIVSNIGGMPEVVKDGSNGFLFEMGNVSELTKIMGRIVREPDILEELRRNIVPPRRTEEEALDYENLYRKLLRGNS